MRSNLPGITLVIRVMQLCTGRKTLNGMRIVIIRPPHCNPQRPAALRSESSDVTTKESANADIAVCWLYWNLLVDFS
jgi:hypothetical protein